MTNEPTPDVPTTRVMQLPGQRCTHCRHQMVIDYGERRGDPEVMYCPCDGKRKGAPAPMDLYHCGEGVVCPAAGVRYLRPLQVLPLVRADDPRGWEAHPWTVNRGYDYPAAAAVLAVPYTAGVICPECQAQMRHDTLQDGTVVVRCPYDGSEGSPVVDGRCPGSFALYLLPRVYVALVPATAEQQAELFGGEEPGLALIDPARATDAAQPGDVPVIAAPDAETAHALTSQTPAELEEAGVVTPHDPLPTAPAADLQAQPSPLPPLALACTACGHTSETAAVGAPCDRAVPLGSTPCAGHYEQRARTVAGSGEQMTPTVGRVVSGIDPRDFLWATPPRHPDHPDDRLQVSQVGGAPQYANEYLPLDYRDRVDLQTQRHPDELPVAAAGPACPACNQWYLTRSPQGNIDYCDRCGYTRDVPPDEGASEKATDA